MAIGSQWQIALPDHVRQSQRSIKVWKQRPSARWFPFQCSPQSVRIKGQQYETLDPCEMLGSSFCGLRGGRKMHIAVYDVDRRPGGFAFGLKRRPFVGAKDFVNQHGRRSAAMSGDGQAVIEPSDRSATHDDRL